jgi:integrase
VSAFLAGYGPANRAWHDRHSVPRGFFRYAVSRGHVATSPLPTRLPQRPPPFVPYIYTAEDLRGLLHAADAYQGRCSVLEPVMIHTLLLLLYGAGLRVSEAINLDRADVDWDNAVLRIRRTKFDKTRLVPLGPQLGRALARYAARRPKSTGESAPFFTTRAGARVNQGTLQRCFRRVCARAGIRRSDGGRFQPRLHDLRHTFAVHRLTSR